MAVSSLQVIDIIEVMENFLEKARPPEHVRPQLDISYNIEGQSVIIYEIRPRMDVPDQKKHTPIAKATYVKASNSWKVYWMRATMKWDSYTPQASVTTLKEFTDLVDKDAHGCFWG